MQIANKARAWCHALLAPLLASAGLRAAGARGRTDPVVARVRDGLAPGRGRNPRLMFDTVLPNCLAPMIVTATLGFLGIGVQAPTPESGTTLSSARDLIGRANWVVTLPGLAILGIVLAINLVGDGLRDRFYPRLATGAS